MRLFITALTCLVGSCGGRSPEPREYTHLPTEGTGDETAHLTVEREELREAPVMVVRRSESPVITFRVVFEAGSAADTPGREGITMLTARLMAEGGAGELSFAELTERLYPMAAEISTYTGRDQTVFIGQVHRDHVEDFYTLFRDILLRPRMSQDDFARIKQQMTLALTVDLRNAQDEELGKEVLQSFLYEGHPYEHPALGTEAGLARIRVDDTQAHRSRVFCAGRAIVGLAGDFPEGFEDRVERDLARLSSDACVGRAILPEPRAVETPRMRIVRKPDAQAVAVSMGFPIAVRRDHPDYPALVLAAAWLGQHRQFVGRLIQSLRGERGLNYGDYAYAEHFTQEGWSRFPVSNDARRQQYFSVWLRPLRPEAAHFAIRAAVRELRNLSENGLTEEQLEHIRTFATHYYALYLQTESRRLGFAIDDAFYGVETPYLERLRGAWAALTLDEVNAAIQRHLRPERLQIVLVASDAEQLADAIATEAESPITYSSEVTDAVRAEDREIVSYPLGIPRDRISIVRVEQTFAD